MLIEDQRFIHEDIERLEQGISDRLSEDPKNVSLSMRYEARRLNICVDKGEIEPRS